MVPLTAYWPLVLVPSPPAILYQSIESLWAEARKLKAEKQRNPPGFGLHQPSGAFGGN
jgi:hypothetical protein